MLSLYSCPSCFGTCLCCVFLGCTYLQSCHLHVSCFIWVMHICGCGILHVPFTPSHLPLSAHSLHISGCVYLQLLPKIHTLCIKFLQSTSFSIFVFPCPFPALSLFFVPFIFWAVAWGNYFLSCFLFLQWIVVFLPMAHPFSLDL